MREKSMSPARRPVSAALSSVIGRNSMVSYVLPLTYALLLPA